MASHPSLDDRAAADLIRADNIDVLIDLDGYTTAPRLGIFGYWPAPVQLSAWGYLPGPGTPGIDYLISDEVIAPKSERQFFSECIIDVACPTIAKMGSDEPSARSPCDDGDVRIGVFSRSEKVTTSQLVLWSEILRARRNTKLVLKGAYFSDDLIATKARSTLLREGVMPARSSCFPFRPGLNILMALQAWTSYLILTRIVAAL